MVNERIVNFIGDRVESRLSDVGDKITESSKTLHGVADRLNDDQFIAGAGALLERVAGAAENVGTYLQTTDFQTLVADAEDFTRERPWTVALAGFAGGLALSRIVKSAAVNRMDHPDDSTAAAHAGTEPASGQRKKSKRHKGSKKSHHSSAAES